MVAMRISCPGQSTNETCLCSSHVFPSSSKRSPWWLPFDLRRFNTAVSRHGNVECDKARQGKAQNHEHHVSSACCMIFVPVCMYEHKICLFFHVFQLQNTKQKMKCKNSKRHAQLDTAACTHSQACEKNHRCTCSCHVMTPKHRQSIRRAERFDATKQRIPGCCCCC